MLKQAEGNFLSSINQFKQPRFEYRNDSQFRLASDDRKQNGDLGDLGDDGGGGKGGGGPGDGGPGDGGPGGGDRGGHDGGDDLEHCDDGSENPPIKAEGGYNSHGPNQRPPPPPASENRHGYDVNTFTGSDTIKVDVKHRTRAISDLTNVAGSGPPVPFGPVGSSPYADAHGNVVTAQIRKTEIAEVGMHRIGNGSFGVANPIAESAPSPPARAVRHSNDPNAQARLSEDRDRSDTGTVQSDTPGDSGGQTNRFRMRCGRYLHHPREKEEISPLTQN
jgi:hypothetical protein